MKKIEIELSEKGYERLEIAAKNWETKYKETKTPEYVASYFIYSALAILWLTEKTGEKHEEIDKN